MCVFDSRLPQKIFHVPHLQWFPQKPSECWWWFQRFYCFSPTYANYTWYNRTTCFKRPSSNVCGCSMQVSLVQISTVTAANSARNPSHVDSASSRSVFLWIIRVVFLMLTLDIQYRYFPTNLPCAKLLMEENPVEIQYETPNEIKRIQIWSVYHVIKHLNMSSSQIASVPAFFWFRFWPSIVFCCFCCLPKCLFVKSLDHPRWWSSSFPANLRTSP